MGGKALIAGEVKAETPKAWLLSDGEIDEWFPKSLTEPVDMNSEDVGIGMVLEFETEEWLAIDKGFV